MTGSYAAAQCPRDRASYEMRHWQSHVILGVLLPKLTAHEISLGRTDRRCGSDLRRLKG